MWEFFSEHRKKKVAQTDGLGCALVWTKSRRRREGGGVGNDKRRDGAFGTGTDFGLREAEFVAGFYEVFGRVLQKREFN